MVADAESGDVIDLLPDRGAGTLEEWLKAHPGRGGHLPGPGRRLR